MKRLLNQVMGRWGSTVTLQRGGQEISYKAFLQETGSRNWQNMEKVFTPLGEVPRGQYLYLGPAEPKLQVEDVLLLDDRIFAVRRAETVYYADAPIYCWGLCVEKGGKDTWGNPSQN
jgi:hypothetical protein